MRRMLINQVSHFHRHYSSYNPFKPISKTPLLPTTSTQSTFKFFSSHDSKPKPSSSEINSQLGKLLEASHEDDLTDSSDIDIPGGVKDVSTKDFKEMIRKHLYDDDDEVIPSIMEAILRRKFVGRHEESDEEIMDELEDIESADDAPDEEIESDFENAYSTEDELDNLYNASEDVQNRMAADEYFNMDERKWDEMIKEATEHGYLKDTKECEDILEDMLSWDKLLPDEIKEKVEARFNELGDMCERGEIEVEEAYALFKEFEDEMVLECQKIMAEEKPTMEDNTCLPDQKKDLDDPPGEGPILRWKSRVVFAPGGDAWHPKNRKVKLSVTVKELGLTKPVFRRLRELVGKRYHPGRDELTITSERFEHREENRKDCLRTLLALIEEAAKAKKLVEDTRTSYLKERLKANPAFMEQLRAKTMKMKAAQNAVPV